MIVKILHIWIIMGLSSYIFVYLFVIFSKSLFNHCPSMRTGWVDIINECDEILDRMTDIGVFLCWLVKGPIMMILVIKTLIDAFIR